MKDPKQPALANGKKHAKLSLSRETVATLSVKTGVRAGANDAPNLRGKANTSDSYNACCA